MARVRLSTSSAVAAGLECADPYARRHHVLRGQPGQGQGAYEQVGGVLFEGSRAGGVPCEGDQFAGGARGGQLVGGLHAEAP